MIKENVAPYVAKNIGVYNKETGEREGTIPLGSFKPNYGTRLYRFGIVSDVHYNDYDTENEMGVDDDGSFYHNDLVNALKFFTEKEGVDFVCASGDITSNYDSHFKTFSNALKNVCPNLPFYTCKGNHDNAATYGSSDALWMQYTYPDGHPWESTTYFYNKSDYNNIFRKEHEDSNTYYFVRTLASGKKDVFIFFSLDYGTWGTSASKINGQYKYYDPEAIIWLEKVLEYYKNERCFVFTHLFFWKKAGNCNEYYYSDNRVHSSMHSESYVVYGEQYNQLNELNNRYKNSIWFTGHSHFKWEFQKEDEYNQYGPNRRCNVCNYDVDNDCESGYNVHIPSLARPINDTPNYSVDYTASQGGIVDVYENYVVVRGIDFERCLDVSEELIVRPEMYTLNSKTTTSTQPIVEAVDWDEENMYVSVVFTEKSQYFFLCPWDDLKSSDSVQFEFEDFNAIAGDENGDYEIMSHIYKNTNNSYIGLSKSNGNYSVTSGEALIEQYNGKYGLKFACSGSYSDTLFPIHLTFVLKLKRGGGYHYQSKYIPVAQYKLDV